MTERRRRHYRKVSVVSPSEGGADGSMSGNIQKGEEWLRGKRGGEEKHLERLNTEG